MSFKTFVNTLPLDKISHFLVGAVAAAMLLPLSTQLAILAVVSTAAAKEVLDKLMGKHFDWADLAVTVLGGVLMILWYVKVLPILIS